MIVTKYMIRVSRPIVVPSRRDRADQSKFLSISALSLVKLLVRRPVMIYRPDKNLEFGRPGRRNRYGFG